MIDPCVFPQALNFKLVSDLPESGWHETQLEIYPPARTIEIQQIFIDSFKHALPAREISTWIPSLSESDELGFNFKSLRPPPTPLTSVPPSIRQIRPVRVQDPHP